MRPQVAVLLAMAAGAPATVGAVVLLPWPLMFSIYGLTEAPFEALGNFGFVIAAVVALGNYWLLAARTIKGQNYKFGWAFRVAVAAAVVVAAVVFSVLSLLAAVVIVVPISAATGWFLVQQRTRNLTFRSSGPPTAATELLY